MQIETDLTKKQTHYLIDLLNNDYQKMRRTKEELLKIDLNFINEECGKTKMTMIEKLEKAMEENETLTSTLETGKNLTFIQGRKDG